MFLGAADWGCGPAGPNLSVCVGPGRPPLPRPPSRCPRGLCPPHPRASAPSARPPGGEAKLWVRRREGVRVGVGGWSPSTCWPPPSPQPPPQPTPALPNEAEPPSYLFFHSIPPSPNRDNFLHPSGSQRKKNIFEKNPSKLILFFVANSPK